VRFTIGQYREAIEALLMAKNQLEPDGKPCAICADSGHQAWECGHNPLYAMGCCEAIARVATSLHDDVHKLEESDDAAPTEAFREAVMEGVHGFLHECGGFDLHMGSSGGPAKVVLP
jgi:hypothetical protein